MRSPARIEHGQTYRHRAAAKNRAVRHEPRQGARGRACRSLQRLRRNHPQRLERAAQPQHSAQRPRHRSARQRLFGKRLCAQSRASSGGKKPHCCAGGKPDSVRRRHLSGCQQYRRPPGEPPCPPSRPHHHHQFHEQRAGARRQRQSGYGYWRRTAPQKLRLHRPMGGTRRAPSAL